MQTETCETNDAEYLGRSIRSRYHCWQPGIERPAEDVVPCSVGWELVEPDIGITIVVRMVRNGMNGKLSSAAGLGTQTRYYVGQCGAVLIVLGTLLLHGY
jgi:hypothetical protein